MESWNWTEDDIRQFGRQTADWIADYLTSLPERPVFHPPPANVLAQFSDDHWPAEGESTSSLFREFAESIGPYPFGQGHPRFWGWVRSPPTIVGVFAESLAAAMNPSCAGGNHAATYVERQVVRWFASLFGLPPETMGLMVSGGSVANLTGLAVARQARAGVDVRAMGVAAAPPLVVYTSTEAHGCIQKGVELLGLGHRQLRRIPVDEHYRMRVDLLAQTIADDLAAGRRPMAVVASAGTVNTGAIDPLEEISRLCRQHDLWLHVDGSYGAPAILSQQYADVLRPLALADSLTIDPHKWLYLPIGAGLILVRDAELMRQAFQLAPAYLSTDDDPRGVGGPTWFSEYGIEQTRSFRALKVWMAMRFHGRRGYSEAIEHDLALAQRLAERVRGESRLELAAPPGLSITCFRHVTDTDDQAAGNALNRRLLAELQAAGHAFVSSTVLSGQFVLRACMVNFRSTEADVDRLVDEVLAIGRRLAH